MTTSMFRALPALETGLLDDIARHTPSSPFNTPRYAAAALRLHETPYALVPADYQEKIVDGCLGLLTPPSGVRKLELPSLPALQDPETFWDGVVAFSARERVTDLVVDTFASESAVLPELPRRVRYRERCEYVIDLDREFERRISKHHKRNARKAAQAGVALLRTRDTAACRAHLHLIHSSANRRTARGEGVDAPKIGRAPV